MSEHDPRRLAAWAAGAVILVALAAWYAAHLHHGTAERASGGSSPVLALGPSDGGRVVVDVSGAVRRPGVYRLRAGARVADALRRAGGATGRADLTQINRAAKLEDGRQVLVPVRTPAGAATAPAPDGSSPAAGTSGPPLNLNTATLEQLEGLDGIGPAMAQRILDYRKAHGGFGSVEELGEVPGIGDKRLAALRDKVRV
jgi:competence protein ComEA